MLPAHRPLPRVPNLDVGRFGLLVLAFVHINGGQVVHRRQRIGMLFPQHLSA